MINEFQITNPNVFNGFKEYSYLHAQGGWQKKKTCYCSDRMGICSEMVFLCLGRREYFYIFIRLKLVFWDSSSYDV